MRYRTALNTIHTNCIITINKQPGEIYPERKIMSNTQLALTNPKGLPPSSHEMQVFQVMAKNAVQSKLYGTNEGELLMKLLAARELGLPPMQALNKGINCIKGSIELSARTMNLMIRRDGHSIKIIQNDRDACILEGKRGDNGDTCRASFTIEDAKAAGLTGNQVWKSYTEDMLWSRALSRLARRLFPDVIGNCYVEGEISEIVPAEIEEKRQEQQAILEAIPEARLEEQVYQQFDHEESLNVAKYINYLVEKLGRTREQVMRNAIKRIEDFKSGFNRWKESVA